MKQHFKYLTHSEEDVDWGLFLTVIGRAEFGAGEVYPPQGHPGGYYFSWKTGRVLDEYQLLYITQGRGIFETRTQKFEVEAGNIIFIQPFVWHRYKPDEATGWTEHYFGFNGDLAKTKLSFFQKDNPVFYIGFNDEINQSFIKIGDLAEEEKAGYQQVAASLALLVLTKVRQIVLNAGFADNKMEKLINQARVFLRSNLSQQFSMEELAELLNISYSLFRTEFKKYTGMPPGQYLLQLRIHKAKNLLANSNLAIKEIAFSSGFESPYYFSKMFKKYVGVPPIQFREQSAEDRP